MFGKSPLEVRSDLFDVFLHLANLSWRDLFESFDDGWSDSIDDVVLLDEDGVFRHVVDIGRGREESSVGVFSEKNGDASEKESFVECSSSWRVASGHRAEDGLFHMFVKQVELLSSVD